MDKKLIALDLDGTLLNSDGIVSEATKVHLQKLNANNLEITNGVIDIKTELEDIREQIQNIE